MSDPWSARKVDSDGEQRRRVARYDAVVGRPSIHVEYRGPDTSPPIVLVHGAPDRSTCFRGALTYHADRRVIVYDRRGYGRSLGLPPALSMTDHANDLLTILEGCTSAPVVVAHSFGSNPTMLAASLRPGAFAAIGLWEPPLPWVDWWSDTTKAYNAAVAASDEPDDEIEAMYRRLLGDEAWEDLPAEVQDRRRAEGTAFQIDMASELQTPFEFEDVQVPALVGYGTATSAEHVKGAHWLVEHLPKARLHVSPGAGHSARTHPREFADFMRAAIPKA